MRSGKAPRHGRYVNRFSGGVFIDSGETQPPEKRPTSAARERPASFTLHFARRLAHQHGARVTRSGNDGTYSWPELAAIARSELGDVSG
ncbi:MAG TPA: hypothetical protein VHL12_01850 [Gemmatimonadaceae bacterium]|nr:hypothetical protein [Gemmatimonadaceae bacterium]